MFSQRFASNHHHFVPRRLSMALAATLALAVLPPARAEQHASATGVHSQSSGQKTTTDAVAVDSDKATQHSIIFVGGRTRGDASRAANTHAIPPGPPAAPQKRSHSTANNVSLNPQPIPPGHQSHRAAEGSLTHTSRTPRPHRPVANPHKGE